MKKIISKIGAFFSSIFGKEFKFLKTNSGVAVAVCDELKKIVESGAAKFVVNIIPGTVDDQILYQLQRYVPKVAEYMGILHQVTINAQKHSDMVAALTEYLQSINKDARVAFWIEFTARLNMALSDNKITFPEAVALTQMVYAEIKQHK